MLINYPSHLLPGNNILYVGVYGPKAPCEEVYIKHIGHHNYQVRNVFENCT